MATSRSSSLATVKRELLALKNRVSYLERALNRAKGKEERKVLAVRRDDAEADTRWEALKAFQDKAQADLYRRSPFMLKGALAYEKEKNAFLRARGLPPEPSLIPKELRRQAKRSSRSGADSG